MNKGDLVKCKDDAGELGIVLAVGLHSLLQGEAMARIMMGDGLTVEVAQADCEVVAFSPHTLDGLHHPEFTTIPANFIELVEAYEVSRAPKTKITHAFSRAPDYHCM